jgi:2-methylaconitate cis-trans-isomerase PrpF
LPKDRHLLGRVLVSAQGSGHKLSIDGSGGGAAVTTKVAMLSPSVEPGCDIDYLVAQVSVEDGLVDSSQPAATFCPGPDLPRLKWAFSPNKAT